MSIIVAGLNSTHQLGCGSNAITDKQVHIVKIPVKLPTKIERISDISAGWKQSLFLSKSTGLYATGDDTTFHIGSQARTIYQFPTQVNIGNNNMILMAEAGYGYSVYLVSKVKLVICSELKQGRPIEMSFGTPIQKLYAGSSYPGFINEAGAVYIFYRSNFSRPPNKLVFNLPVTSMALCDNFAMLLTSDGTVYMSSGQFPEKYSFQVIPAPPNVVQISGFKDHVIALTGNGEVFTYGHNYCGQLGIGSTNDTVIFTQILIGIPIKQVAAGSMHSLFLATNGAVFACGSNEYSQLFLGTVQNSVNAPQQSPFLNNVTFVAAGTGHSIALCDAELENTCESIHRSADARQAKQDFAYANQSLHNSTGNVGGFNRSINVPPPGLIPSPMAMPAPGYIPPPCSVPAPGMMPPPGYMPPPGSVPAPGAMPAPGYIPPPGSVPPPGVIPNMAIDSSVNVGKPHSNSPLNISNPYQQLDASIIPGNNPNADNPGVSQNIRIDQLETKLATAETRAKDYQLQAELAKAKNKDYIKQLQTKDERIESLENLVSTLQEVNSSIINQSENDNSEAIIASLEAKIKALEAQIQDLNQQNQSLQIKNDEEAQTAYQPVTATSLSEMIMDPSDFTVVKSYGVTNGVESVHVMCKTDGLEYLRKIYQINNFTESDSMKFMRECDVLLTLSNHPCIIKFFGYNLASMHELSSMYFEITEKGSLQDVLDEKPFYWNSTLKTIVLLEIAKGMEYMHSQEIMHRDLNPSSIMFASRSNIRITGFNSSNFQDQSLTVQTKGIGLADYQSPEMMNGEPYDLCTDVYSYTIILYYVITGSLPQVKAIDKIKGTRAKIPFSVPEFIRDMIERGWSQNTSDRPTFSEIVKSFIDNQFALFPDVDVDAVKRKLDWIVEQEKKIETYV